MSDYSYGRNSRGRTYVAGEGSNPKKQPVAKNSITYEETHIDCIRWSFDVNKNQGEIVEYMYPEICPLKTELW